MAKRSQLYGNYPVSEDPLANEDENRALADSDEVTLRNLVPARVYMDRAPSGRTYVFERGGAEVKVSLEDVDFLLSMRRGGNPCCGGRQPAKPLFERV